MSILGLVGTGAGTGFTATNSTTIALPAGLKINDVVFAWLGNSLATTSKPVLTFPAGWNQILDAQQTSDFYFNVAWKRMETSLDLTSIPTVTFSENMTGVVRALAISGVILGDSIIDNYVSSQGTSNTDVSAYVSAITVSGLERLGLAFYGVRSGVLSVPPANWTENTDGIQNTVRSATEYRLYTTTTTDPDYGRTTGASGRDWVTVRLTLRSAIPKFSCISN